MHVPIGARLHTDGTRERATRSVARRSSPVCKPRTPEPGVTTYPTAQAHSRAPRGDTRPGTRASGAADCGALLRRAAARDALRAGGAATERRATTSPRSTSRIVAAALGFFAFFAHSTVPEILLGTAAGGRGGDGRSASSNVHRGGLASPDVSVPRDGVSDAPDRMCGSPLVGLPNTRPPAGARLLTDETSERAALRRAAFQLFSQPITPMTRIAARTTAGRLFPRASRRDAPREQLDRCGRLRHLLRLAAARGALCRRPGPLGRPARREEPIQRAPRHRRQSSRRYRSPCVPR
jgi:hypothetical protein